MNNGTFAYIPESADADALNKPSPYAPQQQQYQQQQQHVVYFISPLPATPSTNDEEFDNRYFNKLLLAMVLSVAVITLIGWYTSNIIEHDDNTSEYGPGLALEAFLGASMLAALYAFCLTLNASQRKPEDSFKSDVCSQVSTHTEALSAKWYKLPLAMAGVGAASPVLGQLMTGDVSIETLSHASQVGINIGVELLSLYALAYVAGKVMNYFNKDSKSNYQTARL